MTRAAQEHPSSTWRIVNISAVERGGRIVVGIAAIVAGLLLLAAASSVLAVVLEVVLIVAALDMVFTGATGHCPLYQRLGRGPVPRRKLR